MYNLTVDVAHTFFVGNGQWLVHNAGPCGNIGFRGLVKNQPLSELTHTQIYNAMSETSASSILKIRGGSQQGIPKIKT